MCDNYYKDTKKIVYSLSQEDFSFLNNDLQEVISETINEVGMLLSEYEEKINLIEHYEQMLEQHDIELTTP